MKTLARCTALLAIFAAEAAAQTARLDEISLEELLNVEVTTVARKEQAVARTAAAVYVITSADIRRSGAQSLPDLLRLVPGFSVGEINSNEWAVTSRGFGGAHANKLLVMIDGRRVYKPLNGGVIWNMQWLPLTAIEHIEVVRGPGGSLWGANAINGVVNIVTKSADQQRGGEFTAHVSRTEPGTAETQFGGRIGARSYYSIAGRFLQRHTIGLTQGLGDGNNLEAGYGRARLDWKGELNAVSVRADYGAGSGSLLRNVPLAEGQSPELQRVATSSWSRSIDLTWTRAYSSRMDDSLQVYYSGFGLWELSERSHTLNVDFKRHAVVGTRHDFVIGSEYRFARSGVVNTPFIGLDPAQRSTHLITAFAQDDISLGPALVLTVGSKFERNQDTGLELQPSGRALWSIASGQTAWAAVSRTVRTPNRFERGMNIVTGVTGGPQGLPMLFVLRGSPDTVSEAAVTYEGGYRFKRASYAIDVAGFAAPYRHLSSLHGGAPTPTTWFGSPALAISLVAANDASALSRGAEAVATWNLRPWWRVTTSYAYVHVSYDTEAARQSPLNAPTPSHQTSLRTFVDLPLKLQASALYFGGSEIPQVAPTLKKLDLRLEWAPTRLLRVAGGARNLMRAQGPEYIDTAAASLPANIEPTAYAEVAVGF